MKINASHTTARFRRAFEDLPSDIQRRATRAFRLWREDPHHRSLHFRQVHPVQPLYSVRIGLNWRAVGLKEDDVMVWFWIGSHADYDKLLTQF